MKPKNILTVAAAALVAAALASPARAQALSAEEVQAIAQEAYI